MVVTGLHVAGLEWVAGGVEVAISASAAGEGAANVTDARSAIPKAQATRAFIDWVFAIRISSLALVN